MSYCIAEHRHSDRFRELPHDQGGHGRHKCAGCAYEKGYRQGLTREETFTLNLDDLPESQAGTVRHRSPHAAWAQGYLEGVRDSYVLNWGQIQSRLAVPGNIGA
jgi:hypothetical protein